MSHFLSLILLCFNLVLVVTLIEQKNDRADLLREYARNNLLRSPEESIEYLWGSVKENPQSSWSWYLLGEAHINKGDYSKAEDYLQIALLLSTKEERRETSGGLKGFRAFTTLQSTRYGDMIVNRFDTGQGQSLMNYGEWNDHQITNGLQHILGERELVVEVGAGYGAHTLGISQLVKPGRVIAIEAQRLLFQFLTSNLGLNEIVNVNTLNAKVSATSGVGRVPILQPNFEQCHSCLDFGETTTSLKSVGEETVSQITIDSLGLPSCALLKIDVGNDFPGVLQGSLQTIQKYHPTLWVNLGEQLGETTINALHYLWEAHKYEMFWVEEPCFNPDNFRQNSTKSKTLENCVSTTALAIQPEVKQTILSKKESSQKWMSSLKPIHFEKSAN